MAKRFDVFFIFLFVSSSRNVMSATVFAPPTLDPDSSSLNISKGANLVLTCRGTYYLQWNTTTYGNITSRTDTQEEENAGFYKSTLTVLNVIYSDTGYFSCYYKGTQSGLSLGNISSIYVFVNDPNNLLLPITNPFVNINRNRNTIIPCRPTNPAVRVRLYKDKTEIATDSGDVRFDNRIGFIIMYGSIFFSGSFDCVAELDDVTEKEMILLTWTSSSNPKSIPQPAIDRVGNPHIELGRTFVLTCFINTEPSPTLYFIDWDYPNKRSSRITESAVTSRRRKSRNNASREITFLEVLKNITVENAQSNDQGMYTCTVRDRENNKNSIQTYIVVHPEDEDKLELSSHNANNTVQHENAGADSFKYVVNIKAHPDSPELIWMKNNDVIYQIQSNKYDIRNGDGKSVLIIKHLDGFDTANYTLIARTRTLEQSITFTLLVNEPPSTNIKRTFGYHVADRAYERVITCDVKGLPLPTVQWRWAQCENLKCSKRYSEPIGIYEGNNKEKVTKIETSLTSLRTSLSLTAKSSGYYSCEALNDVVNTPAVSEYLFIVIDAELNHKFEAFDILPIPPIVLERETIILSCLANKFNFSTGLLWKYKESALAPEITLENRPGLTIRTKETKYSHGLEAEFTSVKLSDSGIYFCEAVSYSSGRTTRTKRMEVFQIKAPFILTTNMDGSNYPIERETPFQFICNVTGVPKVKIDWMRDNQTLTESTFTEYNFLHDFTVLEIPRVVTEDRGTYYCIVSNSAGGIRLNASLLVEDVILGTAMPSHVKAILISVGVLLVVLIIIFAIVFGRKFYYDRKERQEIYELEKELFKKGAIERYNPDLPLDEQIDILPYDTRWEFPREKLKLGKTLGQGAFGRVVKAEAQGILANENSTIVAVKMLKEHANVEQRKAIMQELKIMIHLGRHVNILNLLGACVQNPRRGELLIIMENCKYGNLRNYILRHRSNFINQINPETGEIDKRISGAVAPHYAIPPSRGDSIDYSGMGQDGYLVPLSPDISQTTGITTLNSEMIENSSDDSTGFGRLNMSMRATTASKKPLTSYDLIGYAFQTSRGMEYLASRKLVHRDLATRNILLADNSTIKISDFGLTKDCYNKAYYRKKGDAPLPVKWMAIESIRDRIFSTESDVWAYGVVLWELFSLGSTPYPGLEVDENFYKKLLCGYRMDKPEFGTDELYRIMTECWHSDPSRRPTFPELSEWIGDHLQTGMKEHYIQLNSDYLKLYQLTTANPDYMNMNPNAELPDYVNLTTTPQSDDELTDLPKPDYLDMRGSNTSSMRAYEAERAAKNELRPMLSQNIPLRPKNSTNQDSSVKYSPNNNSDSVQLMDQKAKNTMPPSYNSVIGDEFQV